MGQKLHSYGTLLFADCVDSDDYYDSDEEEEEEVYSDLDLDETPLVKGKHIAFHSLKSLSWH